MKKEILVFIFDGYADWEIAYVCSELNRPKTNYIVKTVALDKHAKISMGGLSVLPDYTLANAPAKFAMLILPGGHCWLEETNNAVLTLIEYSAKNYIPVAAICNATVFLAHHRYLDTIEHTGNSLPYIKEHARNYQGEEHFMHKQAVSHANIITANGSAALEFAKAIIIYLKAMPMEKINPWYQLHKTGLYATDTMDNG